MNIKDEYIKLIEYLNRCLLSGKYSFIKATQYCAIVEIDNIEFSIWVANGTYSCGLYAVSGGLFGDIPDLLSDSDKEKLHSELIPLVRNYNRTVLREQKLKELLDLEKGDLI